MSSGIIAAAPRLARVLAKFELGVRKAESCEQDLLIYSELVSSKSVCLSVCGCVYVCG